MDHLKKKKEIIFLVANCWRGGFLSIAAILRIKTRPSQPWSFPIQESPLCNPGLSFLFLSASSFFYPLIHSSITHGIHSCFQWTSWFWKDGLRVPFLSSPPFISWFLDVSSYCSCSFIPLLIPSLSLVFVSRC